MKTKRLLYAMALPMLLGACAQDEFENVANSAANSMATDGVNIGQVAITVDGGKADTRLAQGGSGAWDVWGIGDNIGAVQFAYYRINGGNRVQADPKGTMVAQHPMTLEDNNTFRGHTDFFEGDYFVYYPLQTKWIGDDNIQKNYGEKLNVYASNNHEQGKPIEQEDNVDEHNKWISENALQLSGKKAIKGDKAGLNKGANFTLKQFSNYLSFVNTKGTGAPAILNAPDDLVIYSYSLKTFTADEAERYNIEGNYGSVVVKPFASQAEITNAENLPEDNSFLMENGWSCGEMTTLMAEGKFYDAVAFENEIKMNLKSNTANCVTPANAKSFTFALLPVTEKDFVANQIGTTDDITYADGAQGRIYLVANTNYGIIPQDVVYVADDKLGQSVNGYDQQTTLSEVYWGKDNWAASKFAGLMNQAGRRITCAVEFDFLNVRHTCPITVCNNKTLNEAITWVNNLKEKLGDSYTEQALQLCKNPVFSNLNIPEYLDKKVAEGVEISFVQAEGGSIVTLLGECTISDDTLLETWINPDTKYVVGTDKKAGTLTVPVGGAISRSVYVSEKGKLHNNGHIAKVFVESNADNYNNGTINEATIEEGAFFANGGDETEDGSKIVIKKLNNDGTVNNFATIETVAENNGVIILKKTNENGNQFAIVKVENYNETMVGSIEYTVEANQAQTDANKRHTESGVDMMKALDNYATKVIVNADVVDIRDYADGYIYGMSEIVIAANSELAVNGYAPKKNDVMLTVAKVTVNEGVKFTVTNWNADMSDYKYMAQAIEAKNFELNSGCTLFVNDKTKVYANLFNYTGGQNITVDGAGASTSLIYAGNANMSGVTVTGNVTINWNWGGF